MFWKKEENGEAQVQNRTNIVDNEDLEPIKEIGLESVLESVQKKIEIDSIESLT